MNHKLTTLSFLLVAGMATAQNQGIALVNGVDGYVEIPYSAQVVPQSGITAEAWVTYDDATLPTGWRYPTVFRQNLNAGGESFFLRIEAGNNNAKTVRWLVTTTAGVYSANWTFSAGQLNTWTHLAGTYDGTTARLFVNGVEVATRVASGALKDLGGALRIGKGSDIGGPMEVWNGKIDEARIWPFARSGASILGSMNAELSGMPGTVATWNLNGGYQDSSSTLHATATGSVAFVPGAPALSTRLFLGSVIGKSSDGCLGPIPLALTGTAQSGNAGFGLAAQRVPGSAPGLCVLSPQALSTPLKLLGLDVWVDLNGSLPLTATTDKLGAIQFPLPIPATLMAGGLAAQFVIIDTCGTQGLTASNALVFVITP